MLSARSTLLLACAVLVAGAAPVMARPGKRGSTTPGARFVRPAATPTDFEVTLAQIGRASLDGGVVLELSVHNRASGPRSFCLYYTPFEGFVNDILEVIDDKGAKVAYPGPLASRPPPGPTDYVTLRAGEGRSVRFDVARHYPLRAGVYRVRTGMGVDTLPRSPQLTVEVAASGPAIAPAEALEVVLSPEPAASASRGVFVRLTVRNRGDKPQRFCEYHTPFEGMRNHFIELVDSAGRPVEYMGMMADRAAPTEEDFYTLEPGHARLQRFDLREGYKLSAGAYRARFLGGAVSGLPDSAAVAIKVEP